MALPTPAPGLVIRYDYVWAEHNVDEWPSPGVTTIPGKPGVYSYGFIPKALFAQVKAEFVALADKSESAGVIRTP